MSGSVTMSSKLDLIAHKFSQEIRQLLAGHQQTVITMCHPNLSVLGHSPLQIYVIHRVTMLYLDDIWSLKLKTTLKRGFKQILVQN